MGSGAEYRGGRGQEFLLNTIHFVSTDVDPWPRPRPQPRPQPRPPHEDGEGIGGEDVRWAGRCGVWP